MTNNSEEVLALPNVRWSRRRWISAATGVMLASLVEESEVLASTTLLSPVTSPKSGPHIWRPVPDPSNPGRFLSSVAGNGRLVLAIPAVGQGLHIATWTATGLSVGYYKVTVYYPCHSANATQVLVQKKETREGSFVNWKRPLNQRLGDGITSSTSRFVRTSTNITPYASSNSASYIWVNLNSQNEPYSGTLSIRLSDSGCFAGRIMADKVVLDLVSTIK